MWCIVITNFGAVTGRVCNSEGVVQNDLVAMNVIPQSLSHLDNLYLLNSCNLSGKRAKDKDLNGNIKIDLVIMPVTTGISDKGVLTLRERTVQAFSFILDENLSNLLDKEMKVTLITTPESKQLILPEGVSQ